MYFSVFSPKQVFFFRFFCWFFYDKMIIMFTSIMKNYKNFFRFTIFQITYAMCSTSLFLYITTMISNVRIFFYLSNIYFKIFLYKYNRVLNFHMIPAAILSLTSFLSFLKFILFTTCSLKDWETFFIQSLPLYTSCLFSTILNHDM